MGVTPYFDAVITLEGRWIASPVALSGLHLTAFALLVAVATAWGRHPGRRLLVASGVATVLSIVLVYVSTVRPRDIPIDWVTILHQTMGQGSISHLYGRGAHTGANFRFVLEALAEGGAPNLYEVVWLNLLLALVNAAAFLHVALHVAGRVWALPWVLVFSLNPAMFQASFSELPTHLLGLYFLLGVLAWAVFKDTLPQPKWVRVAALVLCAILTFLAFLTRLDASVIGVVALASHLAFALVGPLRWGAAVERMRDAGGKLLAFLATHPAIVVVLCVIGWFLAFAGIPNLVGRSQAAAIYPFNPYVFALPFFLPMLGLPIGVGIAVLLGVVPAILSFRRFGGLALSVFMLNGAEFAAYTEYYSMARFLSYMLPAVCFLGLFGRQQLDVLVRSWHPGWRRAALIVYLMAWLTVPLPGSLEYFARPEYDRNGGFSQLLLDRDTQQEMRHLLRLTERNPECIFVSRVIRVTTDPTVIEEYHYAAFGKPLAEPVFEAEGSVSLEDFVRRHAHGASCVRLYYGGDCNNTAGDRCEKFVAGRRLVEEERFWSRPYESPLQFGYAAPEIVLATYAWP
jgi:hypothetical protein